MCVCSSIDVDAQSDIWRNIEYETRNNQMEPILNRLLY